mmetsp:Transcript_8160/g.19532  ORF Transcript_8160/g.19532 Transcript_8160/m.19532 type:complete len:243 (-) Transcript_8160:68-796(-)|eukprot:525740-Prymnesium_polylepis.1
MAFTSIAPLLGSTSDAPPRCACSSCSTCSTAITYSGLRSLLPRSSASTCSGTHMNLSATRRLPVGSSWSAASTAAVFDTCSGGPLSISNSTPWRSSSRNLAGFSKASWSVSCRAGASPHDMCSVFGPIGPASESMYQSSSSYPVSAGHTTSRSCGYWLSHWRSAPRDAMLIVNVIRNPAVSRYEQATSRTWVNDENAASTPPQRLLSFSSKNLLGMLDFGTDLYTVPIGMSLLSLIRHELMA